MRQKKQFFMILTAAITGCSILFAAAYLRVWAADGSDTGVPSLFYNDTVWEKDAQYSAVHFVTGITDDFWIPLSFFETIDHIKVRRSYDNSKQLKLFIVSHEVGDVVTKSLSFQVGNEFVRTETGSIFPLRTISLYKERYLPMRDVCNYFGWTFSYTDDKTTLRIMDGGQTLSMDALLAPYRINDTEAPTSIITEQLTPITLPPQIDPPVTIPPVIEVPIVSYRASDMYLTFEDIEGTYTPQLLDILAEYETKAVFFVTGTQIEQYPDLVLRILADGHSIGLHTMTGNELDVLQTDDMLASFAAENELLYQMTKRKTRLVRLPEGSHSGVLHLNDRQKAILGEEGYTLWDWNVAAFDDDPAYDADMVYEKVERALRNSYYPIIRFHCTENTAAALPKLLDLVADTPRLRCVRMTEATIPVVFP